MAALVAESLASSIQDSWAIEGVSLDSAAIRSSLVKRLGLDIPEWRPLALFRSAEEDAAVRATVAMLNQKTPLSVQSILSAHASLAPPQTATQWGIFRHDEEYIVSGFEERKEIVYVAPPPNAVPELMQQYVHFCRESVAILPRPIGAALAHLYFVIIHPFEDGNGRMARLMADKYMTLGKELTFRPCSIASMIRENRTGYAARLDAMDRENGLSAFLRYALHMHTLALDKALKRAQTMASLNTLFAKYPEITEDQRHIIRTMSSDTDKHWDWEEVLFDMDDDASATEAWNALVDMGCIADGRLHLDVLSALRP